MQFPLTYIHNNIVFNQRNEPMAVYRLPQLAYNFKPENVKKIVPAMLEEVLNSFSGKGQILYLTRPVGISEGNYLAGAGCNHKDLEIAQEAHRHASAATNYMQSIHAWVRETYVVLELPLPEKIKADLISSVAELKDQVSEMFAAAGKRKITPELLKEVEMAENELSLQISPTLGSEKVKFRDIDWLIRRNLHRGWEVPPPLPARKSSPLSDAMIMDLGDGVFYDEKAIVIKFINSDDKEQYQAFLQVVDIPSDITETNVEWLSALNFLEVPVDAVVHFECTPSFDSRKKFKRRRGMLKDQIREYNDSGVETTYELDVAEEQAPELDAKLSSGMSLVKISCTFCVWAETPAKLKGAVKHVTQRYKSYDFRLSRPPGDMFKMFYGFIPGAGPGGPMIPCDPLYLAASGVQASFEVGDREGFLLGYMLNGIPVQFKPGAAMQRNRSGAIIELGTLGGGKTSLKLFIIYLAALRGARIVTINAKREDHVLSELPFKTRQIDLSYNGDARINPLTISKDPMKARDIASAYLSITLNVGNNESRLLAIYDALDKVYAGDRNKWHMDTLLEILSNWEDPDKEKENEAHRCAKLLKAYKMSPLGQMVFSEETTPIDGNEQITILNLTGLPLPKKKKPNETLSSIERQALGLMYLATVAAREVVLNYDSRILRVLASDENWKLEYTDEGSLLVSELILLGRSLNIIPLISTQNNSHLDEDTKKNIGYVFAFYTESLEEIKSNAELLQIEANDETVSTFRKLKTGTCFMKDLNNRVAVVNIKLLPEYLERVFDTTPEDNNGAVNES